jgi:RNA polymerase sigma-70 factor (ECF subfamily)
MAEPDPQPDDLPARLTQGDAAALGELFEQHRERLRRMVALRLDPRLRGRLDPTDVIQEAYLEAAARFDEYRRQARLSPYLWLRLLTAQRLALVHRQNFGVQARDVRCEVPLDRPAVPEVNSECLAQHILDTVTTPSAAALKAERCGLLREALERMDPADREILTLRHFEQLSMADAAEVLGVAVGAASMRYYRALKRLKEALDALPGGWKESAP